MLTLMKSGFFVFFFLSFFKSKLFTEHLVVNGAAGSLEQVSKLEKSSMGRIFISHQPCVSQTGITFFSLFLLLLKK